MVTVVKVQYVTKANDGKIKKNYVLWFRPYNKVLSTYRRIKTLVIYIFFCFSFLNQPKLVTIYLYIPIDVLTIHILYKKINSPCNRQSQEIEKNWKYPGDFDRLLFLILDIFFIFLVGICKNCSKFYNIPQEALFCNTKVLLLLKFV